MAVAYNENLVRALQLTREMLALADEGDRDRVDDSCGIVYGVLRDAAYRVRGLVEKECDRHRRSGRWEEPGDGPAPDPEPLAKKLEL